MTSYFKKEIFTDPIIYNGSVVRVDRGLYYHYGIYVHEEPFGAESVIHYTEENGGGDFKGVVRETSVDDFLQGAQSMKICSCNFQGGVYSGAETVERARSKLGRGGYNLIFNNNILQNGVRPARQYPVKSIMQ